MQRNIFTGRWKYPDPLVFDEYGEPYYLEQDFDAPTAMAGLHGYVGDMVILVERASIYGDQFSLACPFKLARSFFFGWEVYYGVFWADFSCAARETRATGQPNTSFQSLFTRRCQPCQTEKATANRLYDLTSMFTFFVASSYLTHPSCQKMLTICLGNPDSRTQVARDHKYLKGVYVHGSYLQNCTTVGLPLIGEREMVLANPVCP